MMAMRIIVIIIIIYNINLMMKQGRKGFLLKLNVKTLQTFILPLKGKQKSISSHDVATYFYITIKIEGKTFVFIYILLTSSSFIYNVFFIVYKLIKLLQITTNK